MRGVETSYFFPRMTSLPPPPSFPTSTYTLPNHPLPPPLLPPIYPLNTLHPPLPPPNCPQPIFYPTPSLCFGSFQTQSPFVWPPPHYNSRPKLSSSPINPRPTSPNPPLQNTRKKTLPSIKQRSSGFRKGLFCVGAKSFSLAFDGGRAAPYHILKKRKKFVGSLWLGLDSLKWVLKMWTVLRQCMDLKGFFRFLRTDYNTLEFSCLQNKNGRFVELLEYHGGAQRGGIRVPEGYRGTGWDRFATELESFFLGKLAPVGDRVGSSRNVKKNPDLAIRDSCDFTMLPTSVIGASNPFKSTSGLNFEFERATGSAGSISASPDPKVLLQLGSFP
jgi:hypothetical protein